MSAVFDEWRSDSIMIMWCMFFQTQQQVEPGSWAKAYIPGVVVALASNAILHGWGYEPRGE